MFVLPCLTWYYAALIFDLITGQLDYLVTASDYQKPASKALAMEHVKPPVHKCNYLGNDGDTANQYNSPAISETKVSGAHLHW